LAARFQIAWQNVKGWVDRYRAGQPMEDRSSCAKTSSNAVTNPKLNDAKLLTLWLHH
jgi:hypothetical protein